jgi:hypothetical protein
MLSSRFIFLLTKTLKESLAVNRFHPAAFQVVITAVKRLTRLRKFRQVSCQGVLDQFLHRTSGLDDQPVDLGLEFRREMKFHSSQVTLRNG